MCCMRSHSLLPQKTAVADVAHSQTVQYGSWLICCCHQQAANAGNAKVHCWHVVQNLHMATLTGCVSKCCHESRQNCNVEILHKCDSSLASCQQQQQVESECVDPNATDTKTFIAGVYLPELCHPDRLIMITTVLSTCSFWCFALERNLCACMLSIKFE